MHELLPIDLRMTTDEAVEMMLDLARSGYDDWGVLGDIRATRDGDLLLFSYTHEAQYARRWNAYERASRGLVLDAAVGYVAARPFDKFFNWGEGGRTTDSPLDYVLEKVDGSLIIAFWHDGRYRTATRGSFTSPQALWAQARIGHIPGHIPAAWTLLLEAVYPENRNVVDYGDRSDLYLLGMRHRGDGRYAPWEFVQYVAGECGFRVPVAYDELDTVDGIRRALDGLTGNEEGFVAVFRDGSRFKFKGAEYLRLHRVIAGLSRKSAVEAVRDGRVEEVRAAVPAALRGEWDSWVAYTEYDLHHTAILAQTMMAYAPEGGRKAFARWANLHGRLRPMLFALRDGKPLEPIILRQLLDYIKTEARNDAA